MLFIYIRHGEPIYETNTLTELGMKQAEKVAKYLSIDGIDHIYSSTSNRAILTAKPTAETLNKPITHVDFADEKHPWENLTMETPMGKVWLFRSKEIIKLFHSQDIIDLGFKWFEHPQLNKPSFKDEMKRVQVESNRFFASLGYQHLGNSTFKVLHDNDDRVVLFAHQGFGYAFLSLLLNIPYPQFCTHFELGHAEITTIEFKNDNGYAYPKVLSLSQKVF